MKKLFHFLILYLICITTQSVGQSIHPGVINGSISDSLSDQPIPYATAVVKKGEKLISGTVSDDKGKFQLTNLPFDEYNLEISSIGYVSKKMVIKLTAQQSKLDLKKIILSADSKKLDEVQVVSMKDIVEDKGDKLVYNAEKDITNAGGTAADVLRKVPTLSVDMNGNVQMRGNGNIKVLINGKPSAMMARNLADALKQMPADLIKSVEVITTPGAKYDAEGTAGVINIITKKGLQGFNGSVNATAGNLNNSLGTNLNYSKNKIGATFSANGYQFRNMGQNESYRTSLINGVPATYLHVNSTSDNIGRGGYGAMSLDYDPDSTSHINFSMNIWGGKYPNNSDFQSRLTDNSGTVLAAFRNQSRFINPYGNGQVDLGYTKTFKKDGPEVSLLSQFSRMPDNYFYETDTYSEANDLTLRQHNTNYSRNKEYTFQADYTHPFKIIGKKDTTNFKLELGTKAILRDIGSEFRVELAHGADGPFLPDPEQSNEFDYFQKVFSSYSSLQLNTKSRWAVIAGARLEQTYIKGNFVTTDTQLSTNYFNLIPNLIISKDIKNHKLKIAYNQRIQRPMIWYLNPWVNRSDTLNISTGNPYLDPELNHGLELSHNFFTPKGLSFNSAVYWRYTDNAIEYLSTVDEKGISLHRPENIAERITYGINTNISGQITKSWNMNGMIELQYLKVGSDKLSQSNKGFVKRVNMNTSYKLSKNFTLQGNGGFGSSWVNLQTKHSPFYWYSLAAKYEFLDNKANLTLGVNNPFNKYMIQTSEAKAPTFLSNSRSHFLNRSVRLTFEWRFGQMSNGRGKTGKKIMNDDRDR